MDPEIFGMFAFQATCLQFQPLPKLLSVFQTQVRKNVSLSVLFSFSLIMRVRSGNRLHILCQVIDTWMCYSYHYHHQVSPSVPGWSWWTSEHEVTLTLKLPHCCWKCAPISVLSRISHHKETNLVFKEDLLNEVIRSEPVLVHLGFLLSSEEDKYTNTPLVGAEVYFETHWYRWKHAASGAKLMEQLCGPAHPFKQQLLVYNIFVLQTDCWQQQQEGESVHTAAKTFSQWIICVSCSFLLTCVSGNWKKGSDQWESRKLLLLLLPLLCDSHVLVIKLAAKSKVSFKVSLFTSSLSLMTGAAPQPLSSSCPPATNMETPANTFVAFIPLSRNYAKIPGIYLFVTCHIAQQWDIGFGWTDLILKQERKTQEEKKSQLNVSSTKLQS